MNDVIIDQVQIQLPRCLLRGCLQGIWKPVPGPRLATPPIAAANDSVIWKFRLGTTLPQGWYNYNPIDKQNGRITFWQERAAFQSVSGHAADWQRR